MRVPYFILLVLLASNIYSQSEKALVKFCPLALADVSMPAVQAGLELRLSNKISWYNELGIKYAKNIIERFVDTNAVASRGYKIKSELRYYVRNKEQFSFDGPYFAANLFFIKDAHNRKITYLPDSAPPARTNDFGVKKNLLGFNLLAGIQRRLSKNIFIDIYGGLGVRLRNISTVREEYNKNTDLIQDSTDPEISEMGEKSDAKGGFSVLPNLTLGFRIGFRL